MQAAVAATHPSRPESAMVSIDSNVCPGMLVLKPSDHSLQVQRGFEGIAYAAQQCLSACYPLNGTMCADCACMITQQPCPLAE